MKIISPKEAMARGLKRYFTGKPCKHGHISERSISNKYCTLCSRMSSLDYESRHREARLARNRLRWKSDPEFRAWRIKYHRVRRHSSEVEQKKSRDRATRYQLANPEKVRASKKRWYEKNKAKLLEKSRKYYRRKREEVKLYRSQYNISGPQNPSGDKACLNKVKALLRTARRIARKRLLGQALSSHEESALIEITSKPAWL